MSSRSLGLSEPLHRWLVDRTVPEHPVQAALREETASLPQARMQISPEQGRFMQWLVHTLGVERYLEVGTFTGYSALSVALALPDHGRALCCDLSLEWTRIAQRAWQSAGVASKIELAIGPGQDTLRSRIDRGEQGSYDLAFIDADKEGYGVYYELCLELIRPGGVIMLDNALWSGRVADPDNADPDTRAIREIVERVGADPRVHASLLPIGDGLLLATRR